MNENYRRRIRVFVLTYDGEVVIRKTIFDEKSGISRESAFVKPSLHWLDIFSKIIKTRLSQDHGKLSPFTSNLGWVYED